MARVGESGRNVIPARTRVKKTKPRPRPVVTPPDQQDRSRAARRPPAPSTPTPSITRTPFERPFAQQRTQQREQTRAARRRLPAPVLAQPPIIRETGTRPARAGDAPLTRAQVNDFLNSRSRVTQAARTQIVKSIRANVGDVHGRERQQRVATLMDDIATDPRLAGTRRAIRHYTAIERETARPQTTQRLSPGPKDRRAGVGFATINLSAAQEGLGSLVAQATPGLQRNIPEAQFVRNAFKDVGTIAAAPFVGGYVAGKANVEDILALTRGANVAKTVTGGETAGILKGVAEGIKEDVSDPAKYFREHPLLFGLDVAGASSVVGHGAGAAARGLGSTASSAGVRGALARAGSRARPALALTDDPAGAVVERRGSGDLIRKAFQVGSDTMREPLRDAQGNPVMREVMGRNLPVLKATEAERHSHLKREADFAASRANNLERMVRDEAGRQMKVRGVSGRRAKDLVAMVVEGTITTAKHFEEDLKSERDRISAHLDEFAQQVKRGDPDEDLIYRHSDEVRAARDRVKMIDEALANPKLKAQAAKIVSVGEDIGRGLNEVEKESLKVGVLSSAPRAYRARLSVPALAHLGARYFREPELRALERSGAQVREPQAMARHQAATQAATGAHDAVRTHERELKKLRDERSRLVGAQGVRRGQEQPTPRVYYVGKDRFESREAAAGHARATGQKVRTVATTSMDAKRLGELNRLDRAIANRRRDLRDARKARNKANIAVRKTPKPPIREALRGPDGRFLSNKEIEDFLRGRGRDPKTVAYLPHRMDVRGGRAFHAEFRSGTRPLMDAGDVRTGSAYRKGVTESSAELIKEHGVRQRVLLAKAQQIDRSITDQGMKHPSGRYYTPAEALEIANRMEGEIKAGRQKASAALVPVRAFAAKLDDETQRIIREELQGPGAMDSLGQRLLNDRVVTKGLAGDKGAQNVVLMPQRYVDRLNKHLRPAGDIQKFFQMLNRPFRFAVLAQARWLTGQFVEPYIYRLTVNGSGLNVFGLGMDITAFNKTIRRMEKSGDPKMRAAAQEIRAQHVGGLGVGGRGLSVRRSSDELAMGRAISRLPMVGQGYDLVRMMGRVLMEPGNLFFRANRVIENVAQRAATGREIRRDIREFRGSAIAAMRLQKTALDEVAQGLTNTPTQRRFLRKQHEVLGKYEGYSPTMRMLIQTVMPFLPWMLNAARFTLWTMPAHHSALTAFLIRVNDVVAKDWEEQHKSVPPGSLKFAIPTGDGGWKDLARYGPYGLTAPIVGSEGKDWNAVIDQFLPQASGAIAALAEGEDPFGRPLVLDPSENKGETEPDLLQRLGIAAYGMLESGTPYLSQARRGLEGGGTPYAGSTLLDRDVKPGTSAREGELLGSKGLNRILNPLRSTHLTAGGDVTTPKPGPKTARQRMLERRAARIGQRSTRDARRTAMLERRAKRLARP